MVVIVTVVVTVTMVVMSQMGLLQPVFALLDQWN